MNILDTELEQSKQQLATYTNSLQRARAGLLLLFTIAMLVTVTSVIDQYKALGVGPSNGSLGLIVFIVLLLAITAGSYKKPFICLAILAFVNVVGVVASLVFIITLAAGANEVFNFLPVLFVLVVGGILGTLLINNTLIARKYEKLSALLNSQLAEAE